MFDTLVVFLKLFFEKVNSEKIQQTTKMQKILSRQKVNHCGRWYCPAAVNTLFCTCISEGYDFQRNMRIPNLRLLMAACSFLRVGSFFLSFFVSHGIAQILRIYIRTDIIHNYLFENINVQEM